MGGGPAAAGRAHEEIVLAAERDRPHGAFGRVVVDLQEAVSEIGPQALEPGERMADRRRQRGLGGDLRQLRLQPALDLVETWFGPGLSDGNTALGRLSTGLLLDGVERGDAFQRLGSDRRALGGMDVEEPRIKSGTCFRRTCARQATSRTGPARARALNPA